MCLHKKRIRTSVPHRGRLSLPDTGDAPINIRKRHRRSLLGVSDVSRLLSKDLVVLRTSLTPLYGLKGKRENALIVLISKENTVGRL